MNVLRSVAEHKFLVTQINWNQGALPVTTASSIVLLTNITQGQTDNNRIGDKVTGSSLEFRMIYYNPNDEDTAPDWSMRCTIFIWKDDSIPTAADIYIKGTTGDAANQPGVWPFNHDMKIKRKILYDTTINSIFDATSGIDTNGYPLIKAIIPLMNLRQRLNVINYQANTITGVNNIFVCLTSNIPGSIVQNTWSGTFMAKYNFIDV